MDWITFQEDIFLNGLDMIFKIMFKLKKKSNLIIMSISCILLLILKNLTHENIIIINSEFFPCY